MTGELSPELLDRLRDRAADPRRRSDASSILGQSVSVDNLLDQLGPQGEQLRSIQTQLQGLMGGLGMGGMRVAAPMATGPREEADPLPPPASDERIAAAEAALGHALPPGLAQLYREIGDGGFGPGAGLFPLDRIVAEYEEMTGEPAGPQNQSWPTNLLPLIDAEPGYDCLDLDSGQIVAWDPEEIEGYSNAAWLRSFKPVAPSLSAWLEEWLDRPTGGELMAEQQASWQAQGRSMAAQGMVNFYAKKTPEERAAMGLPDTGWEEELLRRNGLL
ncbi:MAG TPA: SMI1/KNR4 family protein [Sphingomicrobium sp.]